MNEDINLEEWKAILQLIGEEYNDLIQDYFDRLCSDEPYLLLTKTKEQHIQEYKKPVPIRHFRRSNKRNNKNTTNIQKRCK